MKTIRMLIAVLLLATMLLGVTALQPGAAAAEAAAVQVEADGGSTPALSGNITPTRVQTTMFNAKFEGSSVAGKGEVVDGVYRFTATETDGEA